MEEVEVPGISDTVVVEDEKDAGMVEMLGAFEVVDANVRIGDPTDPGNDVEIEGKLMLLEGGGLDVEQGQ